MVTMATDLADTVPTRRRALGANAGKTATFHIRTQSREGAFGRVANQVFHSVEAVDPWAALDPGERFQARPGAKSIDRNPRCKVPRASIGTGIGSGNYKISAKQFEKTIGDDSGRPAGASLLGSVPNGGQRGKRILRAGGRQVRVSSARSAHLLEIHRGRTDRCMHQRCVPWAVLKLIWEISKCNG
jgi:hypothetical protein